MKKNFLSSLNECSSLSAWSSFILKKFLNLAADSLFVELPPLIDYWSSFSWELGLAGVEWGGGTSPSPPERRVIKRWGGASGGGMVEGGGGFATHTQLWSSFGGGERRSERDSPWGRKDRLQNLMEWEGSLFPARANNCSRIDPSFLQILSPCVNASWVPCGKCIWR